MKQIKIYNSVLILALSILSLTAMGIYFYKTEDIVRDTAARAISIRPEKFTELYFENHKTLPSETILKKENTFEFTIHNLEHTQMQYFYDVFFYQHGKKNMIESGTATLGHGEFATIRSSYTINDSVARQKVVVELTNIDQSIHFYIGGDL